MVTLILGSILTMFGAMFYHEDRMGIGIYDPDPTAADRYRRSK